MNTDIWNNVLDDLRTERITECLSQLSKGQDAAIRLMKHRLTMSDGHVNYLIAEMLLAIRTAQDHMAILDIMCPQLDFGKDAAGRLLRHWHMIDDGAVQSFISECLQAIAAAQRVLNEASHG